MSSVPDFFCIFVLVVMHKRACHIIYILYQSTEKET